jgi:hypothetical protein
VAVDIELLPTARRGEKEYNCVHQRPVAHERGDHSTPARWRGPSSHTCKSKTNEVPSRSDRRARRNTGGSEAESKRPSRYHAVVEQLPVVVSHRRSAGWELPVLGLVIRSALAVVAVPFVACAAGQPTSSMSTEKTCDPSIAMMTTGSQSVIGTRTITKITNSSGQSVQETAASGCSSSSSVCEVPAGTYTVGGVFNGSFSGSIAIGPLTQVGLIDGPSNGQCSEEQTVTIDTNKIEEMATVTSLSEDPTSPYVLYITAIWPAS